MFRILFFLLILMSSFAFAQTEEQPKATKIDEFEKGTNGYVKMKMDYFYVELSNNPAAQGYIINYGTDREIAVREKQIRVSIQWRKYDATRITFVRGGFREEVKSEFWLVPPGAENPQPSSSAEKFDEFGKIPDNDLKARIQQIYISLAKDPNLKVYILIYGSPKAIASQKAQIQITINNFKLDSSRVTYKDAGFNNAVKTEFWLISANEKNKSKTQIWIVPPGAKKPTQ